MGSVSVSSYRCCMFVSCVYPVAVLSLDLVLDCYVLSRQKLYVCMVVRLSLCIIPISPVDLSCKRGCILYTET